MPRPKTKRNYKTKRRGKKLKKTRRRRGGLRPLAALKRDMIREEEDRRISIINQFVFQVQKIMEDDLKKKQINRQENDYIVRENLIEKIVAELMDQDLLINEENEVRTTPDEIFIMVLARVAYAPLT